ncbi:DGQHR domain-containing protein [Aurantimonas marianensis]|uniref:DGQHR domain-containing protein n=1 Tax=Aurantimonas marianensis TaxID=2920428 RepID=A0A9X2H7V3_9HYPH|nr:DGQHR domain-containing protein [Aurantimonas marianensis]MCP3055160.1 DGQHR domain-containing protein [Aurantimonas marianensis]
MATYVKKSNILRILSIREQVLGVDVFRGFARLCDLSMISRADIYDAKKNPTGTQRDLSPKHAREAYFYVRQEEKAYWPEIFLSARDNSVWSFAPAKNENLGYLEINTDLTSQTGIWISRVDGNHRLHYADGSFDGYPAIEKVVSFSLAVDLTQEEEIKIFRDINNNQRRMNTSHLANIKMRLTDDMQLANRDPALYLANRLSKDEDSPFFDLVYYGGKKDITKFIQLNTLKSGVQYMFSQPTRLSAIEDINAQAKIVKNYFSALKRIEPLAWKEPKKYVMLRGAGLWGICFLGAEVIDRALRKGQYKVDDFVRILRSGKTWDWSNRGDFTGLSGRSGAVRIRDLVVSEFADEESVSLKDLMKEISDDS